MLGHGLGPYLARAETTQEYTVAVELLTAADANVAVASQLGGWCIAAPAVRLSPDLPTAPRPSATTGIGSGRCCASTAGTHRRS